MVERIERVLQSGIGDFLLARWEEVKEELTSLDSKFVQTVSSWVSLQEHGIQLPDDLPQPSKRLSPDSHHLLEATFEVIRQLDRIYLTVDRALSATNRRDALYYFDTWIEATHNLCDKINRVVEYSCKAHSLGRRKEKYVDGVNQVKEKIGKIRHGLVHGERQAGGVPSKGITEDQLWEMGVALGLPNILDWIPDPEGEGPPEWISRIGETTDNILRDLGETLEGLVQDIKKVKGK